jgi:hypothetical protein
MLKIWGGIRSGGPTQLLFLPSSSYITQISHTSKNLSKIQTTTTSTSPLFSTRNRHQFKSPDQQSSQLIVTSNIINNYHITSQKVRPRQRTPKPALKQTTRSFNINLNRISIIENSLSHPEQQYDMEQIRSDTSSSSCTMVEFNSSCSCAPWNSTCLCAPSISTIDNTGASTSSKCQEILNDLQRLRTKLNQQRHELRATFGAYRPKQQDGKDRTNAGIKTKKHLNGAKRSILKAGRAIKQHLTIHYHHTENSASFEEETQVDFLSALPNFIQTNNYSDITHINNGTFTPVGKTVNKHFVDGFYSFHPKQGATFGEFTPVGESINPYYIDGEYIWNSDKNHDQDRRIPTWTWKDGKRVVYDARMGYDSMDEDDDILV